MRKVHTKRYNKQVPGHHIQMDVKYLTFIGKRGEKIRRFQYTAIDDATRVRALKIYDKHTQANANDFVDHIIGRFPFRIKEIRTENGLCWEASTVRLSDPIAQTSKSFTNSCRTRVTSISRSSSAIGRSSTTSIGLTAPSTTKHPMKLSANAYNLTHQMSR